MHVSVKERRTCDTGREMMFSLVCLEAIRVAKEIAPLELIRMFANMEIYTHMLQFRGSLSANNITLLPRYNL